jgi:hypothetical protein
MERFNLKKLNDLKVKKEQYQVKIWNSCVPSEILDDVDISRPWESIVDSIKASATETLCYYELKQHERWFVEECSELLHQRKQAKL